MNTYWTTENIPDLTDKIIIVTGGNSGLGFESVKALSGKGAKVIMACRSVEKGKTARGKIVQAQPESDITVMQLDLMDLESIDAFASEFKQKFSRLDVLLNNAGIMMVPYQLTKDNFESQLGTNHLGHFALTGLLLDTLKKTPGSRVVNVSSIAHKSGVMNFDNLLYAGGTGYSPYKAYGRSKLSNLLFTYELQRYFDKQHVDCKAVVAHPGVSDTNLFGHILPTWGNKVLRPLFKAITQPASMGALPQLRAATDPEVKGGEFFGPNGFSGFKGYPILVQSNAASKNAVHARKLWEASEKLTRIAYK
ncbi:MAG TPA: oxidoreductase [Paludibacter sp.]|nr:oxidoreductase [Paludibacter sp.]